MLWVHPVIQLIVTLLAFQVLVMGYKRFLALHCGVKSIFLWKRHVALGKTVLLIWFAGLVLGLVMAHAAWGRLGASGLHYGIGMIMLFLLIIGYATGEYLDRVKKKRRLLPLLHAIVNCLLLLLALYQILTGWELLMVIGS